MKKRLWILLAVLCALLLCPMVAQAAEDETARLNGISANLQTTPLDFSDGNIPVCPYCGTAPESWQVLEVCTEEYILSDNGHYYLAEDLLNNTHYYTVEKKANVCIYLNNKSVMSTKRFVYVASGATLNIMGTQESTVSATAADETSSRGDALDCYSSTINVMGGVYTHASKRPIVMLRGGSATVNLYEGTLIQGVEGYATPLVNVATDNSVLNMYGGEITGGSASGNGGNIYATGAGVEVNLYGGTVTGGTANSGGNISASSGAVVTVSGTAVVSDGTASGNYSRGGNIFVGSSSSLTVTGGTITGGHSEAPDVKRGGGNVHIYRGTMTMNGGTIQDGTSVYYGGNLFLCEGGKADISGGTISGGQGTGGGNICVSVYGTSTGDSYKSTLNFSGGTVSGGIATGTETGGGNILVVGNSENTSTLPRLNISGGTISDGSAVYGGGNLYISRGQWTMTEGTVSGGETEEYGGSVFLSGAVTTANISGGTIIGGYTKGKGGNVYIASLSVIFNLTGGTITEGMSQGNGGNIYANNGRISLTGGAVTKGIGTKGGNLVVGSAGTNDKLTLGACSITGGKSFDGGRDIYLESDGKLLIRESFAGEAYLYVHTDHLTDGNYLNTGLNSCEGPFPGQLHLENLEGEPVLCGVSGDTAVYIASAALVSGDTYIWYLDNAAAVAAYGEAADYLQAAAGELVLTGGDYLVDLAGHDIAVSGTGTVTCFDSANADFVTYGTATFDGVTLKNEFCTNDSYMVEENGVYSFHRLALRISGVSLRPANAGLYYTGIWQCDDLLKEKIDTFGVAVSLVAMPQALDDDVLFTSYGKNSFRSGQTMTGAMVENILSAEATDNADRGLSSIYAAAYVRFADGTTVTSQNTVAYSLYDLLKTLSSHVNQYLNQAAAAESFLAQWRDKGLTGPLWDDLSFTVSQDVQKLNELYAGMTPYYGELHDHAATGGTSDGKQTLDIWKEEMGKLNMDFATIVDHKQSSHMYLEEWDNTIFIGGSEASTTIKDREGVKLHYNMIFSDPAGLEAVVSQFTEFKWQYYPEDYTGTNAEKLAGGWHFSYPNFTAARFTELCEAVRANDGFIAIVHPKSAGYVESENVADAYFTDGVAMEVFYTYHTTRDGWKTAENYKLWTDMLKAGYKVYATAGNDEHNMPSDKAVSVIYASQRSAQAWVDQQRCGNFVAGGVGIRSAMGNTMMGGTTAFADQRFTFSVGDFHASLYDPTHTYRVDVLDQSGVVFSRQITCTETAYFAFDADDSANYYYIEVYDETAGSMIAIGNPIWNDR